MAKNSKPQPWPRANRGAFTVVELDGYLAIARGDRLVSDRPVRELWYNRSDIRVTDEKREYIGKDLTSANTIEFTTAWVGGYRAISFDGWSDWPEVVKYEDVPRPRDGREHGWKWDPGHIFATSTTSSISNGSGWIKEPFPRCDDCYASRVTSDAGRTVSYTNYHDPTWTYDEGCGRCHPTSTCNGKGICAVS